MAFWNSERFNAEQAQYTIIEDGYDPERIKVNAYELFPDFQYFHTLMKRGKETVEDGRQIVIPRGQFALLVTQETINVPRHAMAFISIKFGEKAKGLINVSGFHVDPGFKGRLKFSVLNAGPRDVTLDLDKPLFSIWFSDLCGPVDREHPRIEEPKPYAGKHNSQRDITANDIHNIIGDVASPAQLRQEVDSLQRQLRYVQVIGATALLAVLLPIIVALASSGFSSAQGRVELPSRIVRLQEKQSEEGSAGNSKAPANPVGTSKARNTTK